MVNLTIRLSKGSAPGDGSSGDGSDPASSEPSITVSCPDHLVLADLPVAHGLGSVSDVTVVKILGRKARRRLGDKVHFCVRCDFPIAIYGRLDPCEHIFCLTCARRDSSCYLCGERILRIQRLEVLDGVFICGAPRCLRSFLKRQDLQLHIKEAHGDLIEPRDDKEEIRPEDNSQKAVLSEPQVHSQNLSRSPSSSIHLPSQEQRIGPTQPQPSEPPLKNAAASSLVEEKQVSQNQANPSTSGTKQPEHEHLLKQRQSHGDRPRRQRQEKQQVEENHLEEQAQPDLQEGMQPPQQLRQQGMMLTNQPGIPFPSFSPHSFPPHHIQQEGQGVLPPYPPYQIPHGGHLPIAPPLPPPRPPPALVHPPPLMPPPPPKRGKFEPGISPAGEIQMDPQGHMWPAGKPNFGPNWNFGGWPSS